MNIPGAAADNLTKRLRALLGKEKTASGHLMHGAHACLVPMNYATTNIFREISVKPVQAVQAVQAVQIVRF